MLPLMLIITFAGEQFHSEFAMKMYDFRNVHFDSDGPWCYTTNPNKTWEACFSKLCRTGKIK